MFNFNTELLIQAFGVIFIILGIAARVGYWKNWYWQVRGSTYGYIPYGVIFILASYNDALKNVFSPNEWIIYIFYGVFLGIGLWFSIRPPQFMKPTWVRWIEKYPANIIEAMRSEAKNDTAWGKNTKDETTVDAWAKSVKVNKGHKNKNLASKG
jgi:hypothetical protein